MECRAWLQELPGGQATAPPTCNSLYVHVGAGLVQQEASGEVGSAHLADGWQVSQVGWLFLCRQ